MNAEPFEYIRKRYNVPAEYGREIVFEGKRKGVIVEDQGHYIGVNFEDDKATHVSSLHPTDNVEYLGYGVVKRMTASQRRYQSYIDADTSLSFAEYLGIKKRKK